MIAPMSLFSIPKFALIVLLFWNFAANAQVLGGGESPDVSIWRVLLTLLLCVFVAVLVIWFFHTRNISQSSPGKMPAWLSKFSFLGDTTQQREIEILEMRKLNPQSDICLMRCRNHEYLLLLSGTKAKILQDTELSSQDSKTDDSL